MFGSKKSQIFEAQANELKKKLEQEIKHSKELESQLQNAKEKISSLEKQIADSEQETLKRELNASKAEYEGLKDLYVRKNQEFDDSVGQREEEFARNAARQRKDLENEISDNRQENREYVTGAIQSFSESYNYYLNQIRVLMDALSDVATKTGKALFTGEADDLKANFGLSMAEEIRSRTDALRNHAGDVLLIGGQEDEGKDESITSSEDDSLDTASPEEDSDNHATDCISSENCCQADEDTAECEASETDPSEEEPSEPAEPAEEEKLDEIISSIDTEIQRLSDEADEQGTVNPEEGGQPASDAEA